jgi:hypothetical protein
MPPRKACHRHLPMTTCTPAMAAAGTASLRTTTTPQCPNPTYDCPEVGTSAAAVAAALHGAMNPNPNHNAKNTVGQHPGGGSNGIGCATVPSRTVVVDSFGAHVRPVASIVPQGRAAAAVRKAFEAAFGSPIHGRNTDGGEEMAGGANAAQTMAGGWVFPVNLLFD